MNNVHIVTVATHSQYYFPYLVESCKKNGKELTVLGYGEKWEGFNWRYKKVLEYLIKLNSEDIVCFVDGYDVICTRNLSELPNKFMELKRETKCKIIVGEQKIIVNNAFSYISELALKYYFGKCKNHSLNAGTYIGNVTDLLELIKGILNINSMNNADDQILITKYCKIKPNDITVDTDNKLFLTLELPYQEIDRHVEFRDNKVYYQNNAPFFIHGAGQTYLDNILIQLNYNYNDKINQKIYNDYYNNILFRIKNSNSIIAIIIILIVIIFIILFVILNKYLYKNRKSIKRGRK
jgi:hypothetical protein